MGFPDAWHSLQPNHSVARSVHCTVSGSSNGGGQSPRPVVPPMPLSRQGGNGGRLGGNGGAPGGFGGQGLGGGGLSGGYWARNTGSHILTCARCMYDAW